MQIFAPGIPHPRIEYRIAINKGMMVRLSRRRLVKVSNFSRILPLEKKRKSELFFRLKTEMNKMNGKEKI
jgi:hypothetical protein